MRGGRWASCCVCVVVASALAGACSQAKSDPVPAGIHKIKHVIVIMQENRSFDSYFGTFPGADGIPMKSGIATVCLPDVGGRPCVRPFVDHADVNGGGPHGHAAAVDDIAAGRMDGFVRTRRRVRGVCANPNDPNCAPNVSVRDVMGYHTRSDLPNYWTYAQNFVLQDAMHEPNSS